MARSRLATGFHRVGLTLCVPVVACGLLGLIGSLFPVPNQTTLLTNSLCTIVLGGLLYAAAWAVGWVVRGFVEGDAFRPQPSSVGAAANPIATQISQSDLREQRSPEGIGGWLILLAIGIVIAPFRCAKQAADLAQVLYKAPSYDHGVFKYLWCEFALSVLLVVATTWAAKLFFQKDRKVPTVLVCLFAANLAAVIADIAVGKYAFGVAVSAAYHQALVRAIIGAVVWIPYLVLSKRVENTFVK